MPKEPFRRVFLPTTNDRGLFFDSPPKQAYTSLRETLRRVRFPPSEGKPNGGGICRAN